MRIYLDDDISAPRLVTVLRGAGHDVQIPVDVNLVGDRDPVHFRHAIREGRVLMSRNYWDFELLHHLVKEARGFHPGILIVRRDDAQKRNLTEHDIARAIRNLTSAGIPVADEYIVLNPWQ
jgi:hypothetical protein